MQFITRARGEVNSVQEEHFVEHILKQWEWTMAKGATVSFFFCKKNKFQKSVLADDWSIHAGMEVVLGRHLVIPSLFCPFMNQGKQL